MSLRYGKTRESVRVAVASARLGTKTTWVHPVGQPPPEWARKELEAAGVVITDLRPTTPEEKP